MKIDVTQAMIDAALAECAADSGNGNRSLICPVARGMEAATGRVYEVGHYEAYDAITSRIVSLPDNAVQSIKDFDAGKTVEPFSFEVDIPVQG